MPQVLRLARLGLATAAEIDDETKEASLPGLLVSGVDEEASSSLPSLLGNGCNRIHRQGDEH